MKKYFWIVITEGNFFLLHWHFVVSMMAKYREIKRPGDRAYDSLKTLHKQNINKKREDNMKVLRWKFVVLSLVMAIVLAWGLNRRIGRESA